MVSNTVESSTAEKERTPLLGKFNQPLRLYTQDGRPITDRDGYILQNIIGKDLANIDVDRLKFCDIKGLHLVDAEGRLSTSLDFDPTAVPRFELDGTDPTSGYDCHTIVYDINGIPLTSKQGKPLASRSGKMYLTFGPRGDPISDLAGRDVIDKLGKILTRHKPIKDRDDKALFMFDYEGKPLTDHDSFPLLDICGMKMILFDENNQPLSTLTGSELYDASGVRMSDKNCDFTRRSPTVSIKNRVTTPDRKPAVAFDSNGHPLTDLLGNPLCFNNGNCMISYSKMDKWIDYNSDSPIIIPRKIYDRFTLRGFTNSCGHPIRLFDDYGRPFTDINGVPQRHASGKLMIIFDQKGAPVSDWLGKPLYDANGNTNTNKYFRPCIPISKDYVADNILKGIARGVQYFECTGMPLTNTSGYPLLNGKEEPMITFDSRGEPLQDFRKKGVYNGLGLPMTVSLDAPLLGPGSIPIRLYDKEGRPLTDSSGLPLKDVRGRSMIRIYSKGLGILDSKGRDVYDKNGYSTKFLVKFNASGGPAGCDTQATVISSDGEAMLLYDEDGYPLTEQSGMVLCNRKGEALIKCPEHTFTTTLDDKPVFDVKGRKCLKMFSKHIGLSVGLYDKNSRPLTDRYGSILLDRKGHELVLFDKDCKPSAALVGGDLFDYKGMPLNHPFADPSHIAKTPLKQLFECAQLYDYEDLPLTDMSGHVLYTSFGVSMLNFDVHNRVKSDHSGRPVFDIRGLAVSRTSGSWKDQHGKPYRLYDSDCLPLTDEDGRELYDIEGKSLIRQDSIGRPKFSANNSYVKDSKGRNFNDTRFKPTLVNSSIKCTIPLLEEDKLPLRIYDFCGKPLTDTLGRPVMTSKGILMININNGIQRITDMKNLPVYDRYQMPLGCNANMHIKTMNGVPLLLFDDQGMPLTDANGKPLHRSDNNKPMIVFDMYGRPSSTELGGNVFDHAGRCCQHPQFGSPYIDEKGLNIQSDNMIEDLISVYDKEGRPVK